MSLLTAILRYDIKETDSMTPCVYSVVEPRTRQNGVKTSVIRTAAPCVLLILSFTEYTQGIIEYIYSHLLK